MKRVVLLHAPISMGIAMLSLAQIRKYRLKQYQKDIDQNDDLDLNPIDYYKPSQLEVSMYKMLPLRSMSRLWGWINSIELPLPFRKPILGLYATAFSCNIEEANVEDLSQYANLGEFFRRSLKPGLRPISGQESDVVSPSDGTVLHLGLVRDGYLEQVKGIKYSVESFLGPPTWTLKEFNNGSTLCQNSANQLYFCVIYLAPGDYHRFHSPANWTVHYRRHFFGKLFSVRPSFASCFPNLFSENERVVYFGQWKHGFFSMAAVGAANVGSMNIYFDQNLKTNQPNFARNHFENKQINSIDLKKGDPFGEFNLGSTIVVIFEAPSDYTFKIKKGMKIKFGELISAT